MATIDYKEKYEQALERAKEYAIDGYLDAVAVNDIFPELKDSKDERIRKHLIAVVELYYGKTDEQEKKDCLAWLEKQGEQKPSFCHHEVDLSGCSEEYCKAYYDGWNNCNMQHSQCKSELDDVVKCLINGMKFYYEDNEEATWGTDKWSMPVKHIIEVLEKQCGQKPAWSEEDEKTINNICHIIRQYDKISKKENQPCWYIGDCLLWMQNIKNKVIPQPRQEWSEEDERIRKVLYERIIRYDPNNEILIKEEGISQRQFIAWLKSLRPQSQWKPSEEEITWLYRAADDASKDSRMKQILNDLLSDLKKLMEE